MTNAPDRLAPSVTPSARRLLRFVSWFTTERAFAFATGVLVLLAVLALAEFTREPEDFALDVVVELLATVVGPLVAAWGYATFGGVLPHAKLRRRPLASLVIGLVVVAGGFVPTFGIVGLALASLFGVVNVAGSGPSLTLVTLATFAFLVTLVAGLLVAAQVLAFARAASWARENWNAAATRGVWLLAFAVTLFVVVVSALEQTSGG